MSLPSREEMVRLAESVRDQRPTRPSSFVEAAQSLASFVLREEAARKELANAALEGRSDLVDCLSRLRTLKSAIEKIASAGPDERDGAVAEALVAARAV